MELAILPECYVDTNLIETIAPPSSGYNHQKGCGTVASVMKTKFQDGFAVGIIDKDKKQLDYLNEFQEIVSTESLILHKHVTRHHYIIQIRPAIERFIIKTTDLMKLSLTDYELPSELLKLIKVTKSVNSKNDVRFKRLFRELKKAGAPEIILLANWLEYLRTHTFNSDTGKLLELARL